MPLVFTYGSLMFPEVIEIALGRPLVDGEQRDGVLKGYRRSAIPDRAYPTGLAAPGFQIEGKLLGPITQRELERLDAYEESFYIRIPVSIETSDGLCEALTYIDGRTVLPFELREWDPETFRSEHLRDFVEKLKREWRAEKR